MGEKLGWFVTDFDGDTLLDGGRLGLLVGFVEGRLLVVCFNDGGGLREGK